MMKRTLLLMVMTLSALTGFAQAEQKTWTYGSHTYTQKGTLTAKQYDLRATSGSVRAPESVPGSGRCTVRTTSGSIRFD